MLESKVLGRCVIVVSSKDIVVVKFGGSVLAGGHGYRVLAETVKGLVEEGRRVVVVVSAMKGVTDTLIDIVYSRSGWDEKIKKIMEKYYAAAKEAVGGNELSSVFSELSRLFDELLKLVWASKVVGEVTPYTIASIVSFGEKLSAALASHAIRSYGVKSVWLSAHAAGIRGVGDPLDALVDYDASRRGVEEGLRPLLGEDVVPVVTGFTASTSDGKTMLLGRGGSDYTATILARLVGAREVRLYTDVDGLKTADPRLVPEARHIDSLAFGEAEELALLGAKRMHPRTFEPLYNTKIRVIVTRPGAQKSTVIDWREDGPPVKAVAGINGLSLVAVEGGSLAGRVGVAARVMEAAASVGANIRVILQPVSETRIAIVVDSSKAARLMRVLEERFRGLGVRVEEKSVAVISIVGYGLKDYEMSSRTISEALSHLSVYGVVWAPSSYSVSLLLSPDQFVDGLRVIHKRVVEPWWTR